MRLPTWVIGVGHHGTVTDAAPNHPRAEIARQKGLDQPYIAGGNDPDPEAGRREERRLLRILLIMIVAVVLAGFVLGALGVVVQQLL